MHCYKSESRCILYKRAKWLQNGNKIVTNCCGFVIFYVIMAVTEKIAVFHDGRKSNLKGVERALCPFLLLTEKALIYHLSFTTAGYYINILIVWGVCPFVLVYTEKD